MSVNLDSIDDDTLRCGNLTVDAASVHLSEREDEETIQKTRSIPLPEQPVATESLDGRVTSLSEEITERLEQLEPEEFEELEDLFIENPNKEASYMIRLQNLVAAILTQLQQVSEKDKEKIHELEKEYKKDTTTAANLQRDLGWSNLKFAAITFGASFLQFLSPHDSDRAIANIFAKDVCPAFGKLWSSDLEAKLSSTNNSCNLKMNKYNLLANAEQSKANDKQQMSGVFDKALRGMEAASRSS